MKSFSVLFISLLFLGRICYAQSIPDTIVMNKGVFGYVYQYKSKPIHGVKLQQLLGSNAAASADLTLARNYGITEAIFGIPGGFMMGYSFGQTLRGVGMNWGLFAGGAALYALSVPFNITKNKYLKNSIKAYNNSYKITSFKPVYKLGLGNNGFGMKITF